MKQYKQNENWITASALLSDGEILFWETTQGTGKREIYDFYKEFYYSGINKEEYFENHKMEVKYIQFCYNEEQEFSEYDSELNNLIFKNMAKDFYRMFDISKDSKGEKPY